MSIRRETTVPRSLPIGAAAWDKAIKALELSPQQARIVELIFRGMHDKQIAAAMGLGVPTVRTYLTRAFQRFGVRDRVNLILHVFEFARRYDGASRQDR